MITLSQPQEFSIVPGGGSAVQNWAPTTNAITLYYNPSSGLIPNAFNIDFKIKDFLNTPTGDLYDNLRYYCNHPLVPTTPNWLTPAGLPTNYELIDITESGLHHNVSFTYQNLNLLTTGNYQYKISFKIEGQNSLGNWIEISSYDYTINLNVTNEVVSFAPSSLTFNHFQGTTLASQMINVTGPNWTLYSSAFGTAGAHLNLSSTDFGITFGSNIVDGETIQYAQGSGSKNIKVTLDAYYNGTIDPKYLNGFLIIFAGTTLISGIPFAVNIIANPDIVVTPTQLDFLGIVSVQEPAPQDINVACPVAVTVTTSPWLEYTKVGNTYTIDPISTDSMSPGTYDGFVKFEAIINSNPVEKIVAVKYILLDFLTNPYEDGRKAFTLDIDFFECFTINTDSYFQINAAVKTHEFFTTNSKITTIPLKLVTFRGQGKFNLGQNIHRIMSKFLTPVESMLQYKLAELELNVQEKKLSDDSLIRERNLPRIKYVAGIGSENKTGLEILAFNKKATSVKKTSFYYLNMLVKDGPNYLHIYKNDVLLNSELLPNANDFILQKKISFNDYNQGDKIQVVVSGVSDSIDSRPITEVKEFHVINPGPQCEYIEWENEFLLMDIINLTGEFNIKTDIEVQENKLYKNLVERLEHISNTTSIKFSINTGWLIQNDVDTIESLMRSKRIWLTDGDSKIELRPGTKSLIKKDTQRELIEYALEFTINKTSNEKTYSR